MLNSIKASFLAVALVAVVGGQAFAFGDKTTHNGGDGGNATSIATGGQGGKGGAGGDASVGGDDTDVDVYNPGAASAAGNNVWKCAESLNLEARTFIAGAAVGIPQSNEVCEAGALLDMAQQTGDPVVIKLAVHNLQNILQDKVGYNPTVQAIKASLPKGEDRTHLAKPAWCDRVRGSSTESDKKACGYEG